MRDLLNTWECGFSAWNKSIDETAIILNQKVNDKDWLKQAGKQANKLAIEYFDRDKLSEQLMKVLEIAVNGTSVNVESVAPGELWRLKESINIKIFIEFVQSIH